MGRDAGWLVGRPECLHRRAINRDRVSRIFTRNRLQNGHRVFDGTSVAVQLYEAEAGPDSVVIGPDDHPHLRDFIRPARRALLLAALGARRGEGLFVLDAVRARQPVAADPVDVLPIPRAYRLDDLTYGILWAVLNLDDKR